MNNITQDMKYRQSLVSFALKHGVSRASRKYNKSRSYIYFWLSRCRALKTLGLQKASASKPKYASYPSAIFLEHVVRFFKFPLECVQTDNGFEFTNRFSATRRDLPTLFEHKAICLGIRHKLIRPYTQGTTERSSAVTRKTRSG